MKQATVKLPSGTYTIAESDKNGVVIFGTSMIGWQLLGADPTALTEEEAGKIVECLCKPVLSGMLAGVYKNYNLEAERKAWAKERVKLKSKLDTIPVHPDTATESLDSLAASLGVSKPYVILKNVEK